VKVKWLDRRVACPGPYLALVLSQEEFDAALRHCGRPVGEPYLRTKRSDATAHYFQNRNGELVLIVALGDTTARSGIEVAGLLVHEAVHAWQQHCESIGEDRPAVEQEAYGIQAIAQELMAEYARRIA
jgi:hypothetical protein